MKLRCPNVNCTSAQIPSPKLEHFAKNGSYFRRTDSKWVERFACSYCRKSFSYSTFNPTYRQKKRRISEPLRLLLNSGVSQKRAAKILKVNEKTVVRRFRFLAQQARLQHEMWLTAQYQDQRLNFVQFDDLETAEHTKCKPLSVTLAIEPSTRKILHFQVSRMPAKGLLSRIALKKYGPRMDERPKAWDKFMEALKPIVHPQVIFASDENPHYPKYIKKHHPLSSHHRTKGGRGSVSGQGELKKLRFDPLFSLNHTCAMLRANLNRLFRRTWCMSKTIQGLIDHLSLYVIYHNLVLTPPHTAAITAKGGS